jgi:hypothetical protein
MKYTALGWVLVFFLSGCLFAVKDDRQAGAEDFPNTLEPLGKIAVGQVAAQGDWNEFDNVPASIAGIAEADSNLILAASADGSALPKTGLGSTDTTFWDMTDTALGMVKRIRLRTGPGVQHQEDTLVYRYDEAFRTQSESDYLLLARKGEWTRLGLVKTWRFTNTDTLGPLDHGILRLIVTAGQITKFHKIEVKLDSAADPEEPKNFDWISYTFIRTRGMDTLETVSVNDNDSDGLLWNGDSSGEVRMNHVLFTPPLRPALENSSIRIRGTLIRAGFVLRPHFFQEDRQERDGKVVSFRIRGRSSDSSFSQGDTVNIDRTVTFDTSAAIVERSDAFKVVLSALPRDFSNNRLLSYSATWIWRLGLIRESQFTFKADAPVSPAELRAQGTLHMTVVYADGAEGQADGSYSKDKLTAKYKEMRKGITKHYQVIWDKLGEVLERAMSTG